ncbi:MAG TPA: hypothetical protein VIA18_00870 [Polyangia bacterium]|jgi:hypothetical protein|nr:hypothetical protein [Polyangia bacterium]HWE29385.1 hypothetical protein [Polyangia bacterium]
MPNKWKVAFFVLLGCWIVTLVAGAYLVVDRAVAVSYMQDGYADCEAHRDFLHALVKGRLTRADIASAPDGKTGVQIKYDKEGKYVSSRLGASSAGQQ